MAEGFGKKLARLGSESLVYGLSSIVGRLLSFLLQPYYAHQFNPAQNGVQSVVYSYIPIISIGLYLGMDVAYMRAAAGVKTASLAEQQRAFSATMGAVLGVGGMVTLLAVLAGPWVAPVIKLDLTSFRYMMAIVFSDALLAVPYAHLRMTNRSFRYAGLRLLFVGVSVGLNIILIGRLHWGVEAIFLANLAANLVVLALFLGEIARFFRPARLVEAQWGALWKYALPIMPAMLGVMLVENGDRIVLNFVPNAVAQHVYGMGTKDVVGIYSFNYKLGVAMLLVVQMFRMAWTPFALQQAEQEGAPQLFSRALTGLMLVCSLVFLGVSILLPSFVRIPAVYHYVKPPYWAGLPIVPVILLGYVFSGLYAVVTTGLYIERKTHVLPWIAGAGAVVNVGMCLIAASRWGMVAVAWATPVAYGLMAALGAWRSQMVYRVPFEWGRLVRLGAIVTAIFVADRVVSGSGVSVTSDLGLAVKFLLLALFPVLLWVTRFFRAGEVSALRSLATRGIG
ncbi:MAG: lipopolysaccharide biosynthesis protein, partial [Gemmatimonadaceae bacterium]